MKTLLVKLEKQLPTKNTMETSLTEHRTKHTGNLEAFSVETKEETFSKKKHYSLFSLSTVKSLRILFPAQ